MLTGRWDGRSTLGEVHCLKISRTAGHWSFICDTMDRNTPTTLLLCDGQMYRLAGPRPPFVQGKQIKFHFAHRTCFASHRRPATLI